MTVDLSQVAHLVRGVARREVARGASLVGMVFEAGRVAHVGHRVPAVRGGGAHEAVAVSVDLTATLRTLRACPCAVCHEALARLDGIPAGHARVFLHDAGGERAVDVPVGWFADVIPGDAGGGR